jgi:putative transposase
LRYYDQAMSLTALKAERSSLADVQSQALQNVAGRLDLAFRRSFATCGHVRRRDTQLLVGCKLDAVAKCVRLHGVGEVKIMLHHPLEGTPRPRQSAEVVQASGTSASRVSVPSQRRCLRRWQPVGIDVGLKTFATLSTGADIANPRFIPSEEKALATVQRAHSKLDVGRQSAPNTGVWLRECMNVPHGDGAISPIITAAAS